MSEKLTHSPQVHPLEHTKELKARFLKEFDAFKHAPSYESYAKASATLREASKALQISPSRFSHEQDLKDLAMLNNEIFGKQIFRLIGQSIELCRQESRKTQKVAEISKFHGILCLILEDAKYYYDIHTEPRERGGLMQYRIDALTELQDCHKRLKKYNPDHEKAEIHYKNAIIELQTRDDEKPTKKPHK